MAMTLLKWDDAFITGIVGADYEHRKLIDLSIRALETVDLAAS